MAYETNYVENEILSLDKDELISFIYRGILNYIYKLENYMETENAKEKVLLVNKIIDIISYLRSILDFEKGGIISKNLDNLYIFSIKELTEANISNDIEKIKSVENIFKELLDTWNQMIKKNKARQSSSMEAQRINPEEKRKQVEIYG